MLTASYKGQEFSRVGYYVSVDYIDTEMKENPPTTPIFEKVSLLFANLLRNTHYGFRFFPWRPWRPWVTMVTMVTNGFCEPSDFVKNQTFFLLFFKNSPSYVENQFLSFIRQIKPDMTTKFLFFIPQRNFLLPNFLEIVRGLDLNGEKNWFWN